MNEFVTDGAFEHTVGGLRAEQARIEERVDQIEHGNEFRNGVVSRIQDELAEIRGGIKVTKYLIGLGFTCMGVLMAALKLFV